MSSKIIIYEKAHSLNAEGLFVFAQLDQDYFPTPWDQNSWDNLFLTSGERFLIGLFEEKELAGFILYDFSIADSFAHLLKIVAAPKHRGKGFGSRMMEKSLEVLKERGIKEFFLEVEEDNANAIALYQRFGFKVVHKKKQFYSNGATALIMTLST